MYVWAVPSFVPLFSDTTSGDMLSIPIGILAFCGMATLAAATRLWGKASFGSKKTPGPESGELSLAGKQICDLGGIFMSEAT